ncbi:MAG TPA: hypothetical protein HPP77_03015 [Candidatus Hydrogenedentes bacterium]|nr:hypothetical protein [Candidatus Hydrogenedentota bacterium]
MTTSKKLIGIDIGTSGLKVSAFDEAGTLLAQAYRPTEYLPLQAGHMEQSPEQWRDAMFSALQEILAGPSVAPDAVAGIGLCGFHHCPAFLQEDGRSSRPAILMHDPRLPASRDDLAAAGILDAVEQRTQSMVSAGHFPPIFHYVLQHDANAIARTRWILLAKDYLRFALTGEVATEICDATGTNLIEPGSADWSEELCRILSVPISALPAIKSPTEVAGEVTRAAAKATGLVAGTPVVYGGGDSHCALLGMGCVENGDTGLLLGTNSTLRTVFDAFVAHPEIKLWVQHHVVPEHYTVSASSMAGASVMNWFRQNLYVSDSQPPTFEEVEADAARIPVGSGGLVFLPYLYGERCPFYDPQASAAFAGIKHWHRPGHFARSVIEGVALNIANCFALIQDCAGVHNARIDRLRFAGGGSRSSLWHQVISDCLGRPIQVMNTTEAGTLGAALLAGVGIGVYTDCRAAAAAAVTEGHTIEPIEEHHAVYAELRENTNELYRRIHQ